MVLDRRGRVENGVTSLMDKPLNNKENIVAIWNVLSNQKWLIANNVGTKMGKRGTL